MAVLPYLFWRHHTQEVITTVLHALGGSKKGRGYMCTYGWFTLRFDRKEQNSVKQLSFNKKINTIKKNFKKIPHAFSILKGSQ